MMKGESIKIEMSGDFKRIHVNKNSSQIDYENFSILILDALVKEINTKVARKWICSIWSQFNQLISNLQNGGLFWNKISDSGWCQIWYTLNDIIFLKKTISNNRYQKLFIYFSNKVSFLLI